MGLAVWAFGSPAVAGRARAVLGAISAVVLGSALAWAWPALGEAPPATPSTTGSAATNAIDWQTWSPEIGRAHV